MKSSRLFFLLFLFFLSRLFFITPNPVFFDSQEYIRRFSDNNFLHALTSGHLPLHAGYSVFGWPLFHLGKLAGINPVSTVLFFQVILSTITVILFYKATTLLTSKTTGVAASIFLSLLPLYWITNVTVMMETIYISFFMLAFFFLVQFLTQKKNIFFLLFLSAIAFGYAFFTHLVVFLWIPLLLFLVFTYKKQFFFLYALLLLGSILLFSFINAYLISITLHSNFFIGLGQLFLSKSAEHAAFNFSANEILVFARNAFIPQFRNNTVLITISGFVALFFLYKTSKRFFFLGIFWIIPFFIANQWWDSLLFGRHALLASFGFAFLAGYLFSTQKNIYFIYLYIAIISLGALSLLRLPIPYLEEAAFIQKLPKGLFIESHFARPYTEHLYQGTVFYVNEPGYETNRLPYVISKFLMEKKPVFISSAAISDPYGLYSGPFLHSLSLSYAHPYALQTTLTNFTTIPYHVINQPDNLIMYKITNIHPSSPYPPVKHLDCSRRRIDYFDPLSFPLSCI